MKLDDIIGELLQIEDGFCVVSSWLPRDARQRPYLDERIDALHETIRKLREHRRRLKAAKRRTAKLVAGFRKLARLADQGEPGTN